MEEFSFAWDDSKRLSNVAKHKIDFHDAVEIFLTDHLILPARSDVETRWIAVGAIADQVISVIFTRRESAIRIISARKARKDEREQYQALYNRRNPPDEIPH